MPTPNNNGCPGMVALLVLVAPTTNSLAPINSMPTPNNNDCPGMAALVAPTANSLAPINSIPNPNNNGCPGMVVLMALEGPPLTSKGSNKPLLTSRNRPPNPKAPTSNPPLASPLILLSHCHPLTTSLIFTALNSNPSPDLTCPTANCPCSTPFTPNNPSPAPACNTTNRPCSSPLTPSSSPDLRCPTANCLCSSPLTPINPCCNRLIIPVTPLKTSLPPISKHLKPSVTNPRPVHPLNNTQPSTNSMSPISVIPTPNNNSFPGMVALVVPTTSSLDPISWIPTPNSNSCPGMVVLVALVVLVVPITNSNKACPGMVVLLVPITNNKAFPGMAVLLVLVVPTTSSLAPISWISAPNNNSFSGMVVLVVLVFPTTNNKDSMRLQEGSHGPGAAPPMSQGPPSSQYNVIGSEVNRGPLQPRQGQSMFEPREHGPVSSRENTHNQVHSPPRDSNIRYQPNPGPGPPIDLNIRYQPNPGPGPPGDSNIRYQPNPGPGPHSMQSQPSQSLTQGMLQPQRVGTAHQDPQSLLGPAHSRPINQGGAMDRQTGRMYRQAGDMDRQPGDALTSHVGDWDRQAGHAPYRDDRHLDSPPLYGGALDTQGMPAGRSVSDGLGIGRGGPSLGEAPRDGRGGSRLGEASRDSNFQRAPLRESELDMPPIFSLPERGSSAPYIIGSNSFDHESSGIRYRQGAQPPQASTSAPQAIQGQGIASWEDLRSNRENLREDLTRPAYHAADTEALHMDLPHGSFDDGVRYSNTARTGRGGVVHPQPHANNGEVILEDRRQPGDGLIRYPAQRGASEVPRATRVRVDPDFPPPDQAPRQGHAPARRAGGQQDGWQGAEQGDEWDDEDDSWLTAGPSAQGLAPVSKAAAAAQQAGQKRRPIEMRRQASDTNVQAPPVDAKRTRVQDTSSVLEGVASPGVVNRLLEKQEDCIEKLRRIIALKEDNPLEAGPAQAGQNRMAAGPQNEGSTEAGQAAQEAGPPRAG
eukprot:gene26974-34989_t